VAGRRRPLRARDGWQLDAPGRRSGADSDRGLSATCRRLHREGGQHRQQRTLDAVALRGGRASGRCEGGHGHRRRPRARNEGRLRGGRGLPRPHPAARLGLRGRERPCRSAPGGAGDQRALPRRRPGRRRRGQGGHPGPGIPAAARRRIDGLRQLALLRELHRGGQPGRAALRASG
jgi:hypothetical protein